MKIMLVACLFSIVISSQDDFQLVNLHPSNSFVINGDINLQIIDNDLIDTLSGILTGTRGNIVIEQIQQDFQFIRSLLGVISDFSITITSNISSQNNFSIIQSSFNAQLLNMGFSLLSSQCENQINISLIGNIYNSLLKTCFFKQIFESSSFVNSTVLGISQSIVNSQCTNININQSISNVSQVVGACFLLSNQIHIKINQTVSFTEYLYGLAQEITENQVNISIYQKVKAIKSHIALSQFLRKNASTIDVEISAGFGNTNQLLHGLSSTVQGNLQNINLLLTIMITQSSSEILTSEISGLANVISSIEFINNIAIKIKIVDINSMTFVNFIAQSDVIVGNMQNLSINYTHVMGNCQGTEIAMTKSDFQSNISQLYILTNINIQSVYGDITIFMLANTTINSQFQNVVVNFLISALYVESQQINIYMTNKSQGSNFTNISANIEIDIATEDKGTELEIYGFSDTFQSSNLYQICLYFKVNFINGNNFHAIAYQLFDSKMSQIAIYGKITCQVGNLYGVAQYITKSQVKNVIFNLQFNGEKSQNCFIIASDIQASSIGSFNDQTSKMSCQKSVQIFTSNDGTLDEYCGFSKVLGKNESYQSVELSDFQSGPYMNQLIQTNDWTVQRNVNQDFVYLKNMFTLNSLFYIEVANPKIVPFNQVENGSMYLEIQQNLCIGDCNGVFDGNTTTCDFGYEGSNCNLLDCTKDICGINGKCYQSGCECGPGQKGKNCEENYCEECIGGINNCIDDNNYLPTCSIYEQSECLHGTNLNQYCICDSGYSSINDTCDVFECKDDRDCNTYQCLQGECLCETPKGGLSCKFSTQEGDEQYKQVCNQEYCQYGLGCVYLYEEGGEWECSMCEDGRELPNCVKCSEGYLTVENNCFQICEQCINGECYFEQACNEEDIGQCQFSCTSCIIGISGKQCNKCDNGDYFYMWECRIILDPGLVFGYCFQYEDDYICLSCLENYVKIDDKCIPKCTETYCINGYCLPNEQCRCDKYFYGPKCDTCISGTQLLDNQCVQSCETCNGQCYYNANHIIFCQSCDAGYDGQQCQECRPGYLDISGSCFIICDTCNGQNCYVDDKEVKICPFGCYNGYIGQSCEACDTGYDQVLGKCQLKCQTCVQGDCYQIDQISIHCIKCNFNLVGTQCDNCLEGFVMDNLQCNEQVTTDQCYIKKDELYCLSCEEGKVLVQDQCYKQCDLPECAGNCYFFDTTYVCISCYSGYILSDSKCWKQNYNPNGLCYENGETVTCKCYEGYKGNTCEECKDFEIDKKCYFKLYPSHGDCYKDVADFTKIVCKSCLPQYLLPFCTQCNTGYKLDSNGNCVNCTGDFVSSNTLSPSQIEIIGRDKCVIQCDSLINGVCFYVGDKIICTYCKDGFNLSNNCESCQIGYIQVGSYCFTDTGNTSSGDNLNFQCDSLQESFNCSLCTIGDTTSTQCQQHSLIHPGSCFIIDNNTLCENENCLSYQSDTQICTSCDSDLKLYNQSCWKNLKQQDDRFRGVCFISNEVSYCESCENGWDGIQCSQCLKNYLQCPCQTQNFTQCCCQQVQGNGICYKQEIGSIICQQCKKGFILKENRCIPEQKSLIFLLYWILPMVLVLLIVLGIIIWLICIGNQKRLKLKIKSKKIVHKVGIRLLFVILAQILSFIIALQDQFINDFYMQISVNIFSMLPFVIYFILLVKPDKNQFYYNKSNHYFLFVLASILEICYNIVQFSLVPDILQEFGQQMYKLAGPPVTLFLCIFFARYIFRQQQKVVIYCGLAIPVSFQFILAILESQKSGFFTGMDGISIVIGQFMVGLAIIINGLYFYSLSIILGKYGEIGSIGRFAVSSILINSIVALFQPQQIILSIFQTEIFSFSLISQIFFNIINIIVMSRLSAVEFSINLISSAIWTQFIHEVGSLQQSKINYYPNNIFTLILEVTSLLILFISIILFYLYESAWFNNDNEKIDQTENCGFINPDTLRSVWQDDSKILKENQELSKTMFKQKINKTMTFQNLLSSKQQENQSYKLDKQSPEGQEMVKYYSTKTLPLFDSFQQDSDIKLFEQQSVCRDIEQLRKHFQ